MSSPAISVIVPAYNAAATIGACVAALRKQDFDQPYEILVVDDGSTDDTAAVARREGATVISTPRGRPAAARNAGFRAATGDIVCCTDADCVPHSDWLRNITAPFTDPAVVASKGIYQTRQRQLVARFVQLEYEDKYDLLRLQENIDFIDTYSAAYRREVVLASGGFDEWFDYLEDQELSFRLAALGLRMVFVEGGVVDHLHSATLGAYLRKKAIIGYWKAQVVRRFPARAVKDSHTPQVMKVQMALAVLILAGVALGAAALPWLIGRGASIWAAFSPAAVLALLFTVTTLPFMRKAWAKDRAVGVLAPGLLFGRAAALSAGYLGGVLRPAISGEGRSAAGATSTGAR